MIPHEKRTNDEQAHGLTRALELIRTVAGDDKANTAKKMKQSLEIVYATSNAAIEDYGAPRERNIGWLYDSFCDFIKRNHFFYFNDKQKERFANFQFDWNKFPATPHWKSLLALFMQTNPELQAHPSLRNKLWDEAMEEFFDR